MSVVAWRDGVVAADWMLTAGTLQCSVRKVWRLEDGSVIAGVGQYEQVLALVEWWRKGRPVEGSPVRRMKEVKATIVVARGRGCWYWWEEMNHGMDLGLKVRGKFMAWGSGAEVAMGAMAMGASAVRAVEVANRYADGCGLGVDWVAVK